MSLSSRFRALLFKKGTTYRNDPPAPMIPARLVGGPFDGREFELDHLPKYIDVPVLDRPYAVFGEPPERHFSRVRYRRDHAGAAMNKEELMLRYGPDEIKRARIDLAKIPDGTAKMAMLMERFGRHAQDIAILLREDSTRTVYVFTSDQ